MSRRTVLNLTLAAAFAPVARAYADGGMSRIPAYAFSFPALSGGDIRLAAFTGKPLLVVNTASGDLSVLSLIDRKGRPQPNAPVMETMIPLGKDPRAIVVKAFVSQNLSSDER